MFLSNYEITNLCLNESYIIVFAQVNRKRAKCVFQWFKMKLEHSKQISISNHRWFDQVHYIAVDDNGKRINWVKFDWLSINEIKGI